MLLLLLKLIHSTMRSSSSKACARRNVDFANISPGSKLKILKSEID